MKISPSWRPSLVLANITTPSRFLTFFTILSASLWQTANGLTVTIGDNDSIYNTTAAIAEGLLHYYPVYMNQSGAIYGMMTTGYYWYESGAAFGSLLDYWFYTGDDQYNSLITDALQNQCGPNYDFMPTNQTVTEGNDDQAFYAFTALSAVERNFTNPPADKPQWLYMVQAAFNTMKARWDTASCNGGLRWQIFAFNNGYDYKNTVSNGCFFHLAARLYRYTANDSYFEWADKTYNWIEQTGLIDDSSYSVYDGGTVESNCTTITKWEWTYNYGLLMAGAAYIYNATGNTTWLDRTLNFVNSSSLFFDTDGIMQEVTCEPTGKCNTDEQGYKAYFSRFMGLTIQLVPQAADTLMGRLETSAVAAAAQCNGGSDGITCGTSWINQTWDGTWGLGQQMCALEVVQNLLVTQRPAPYTATTGGSSIGSYDAGENSTTDVFGRPYRAATTGDKAGAGVITAVIILAMIGCSLWMLI